MENNYTIAESFILPSGGDIYEKKVNPQVSLRSMTARDEMRRLQGGNSPFKTLSDIIEGCMIDKPAISVYDMALGDYEFLLHKLRIVTYGPDYKMVIGCPYCGEEFEATVSLEDLEAKDFDRAAFEENRSFTLPRSKKLVTIKFQTPRILDNIELKEKEMKRKVRSADIDFKTFATLLNLIESVDGQLLNSFEIETFINQLPAMDMKVILQKKDLLNSTLGLTSDWLVPCKRCGNDIKTFFRFGPEFFGPTID